MIVVDTSFLVSFFMEKDVNYSKAVAIFEEHRDEEVMLPEIILFETLTVIDYKGGMEKAREAHEMLMANRQIRVFQFAEDERKSILDEFFRADGKLSVQDAAVAYTAKKAGVEALAFDADIKKAIRKK